MFYADVLDIIIFKIDYSFIYGAVLRFCAAAHAVVRKAVKHIVYVGQGFELVSHAAAVPYGEHICHQFAVISVFVACGYADFVRQGDIQIVEQKIDGYVFSVIAGEPLRTIGDIVRQIEHGSRLRAKFARLAIVKEHGAFYYIKKP